ncbi:MAG: hypothetical protein IT353_01135 [Gemmatimonadaceae bacterium]|nr:hypothetical protein [Gemmatimonadaceae bacterium]
MITPREHLTVAALFLGVVTSACTRRDVPISREAVVVSGDSARGIVRRVGPDPTSRIGLFGPEGSAAAPLALSAALPAELRAAEGLEIVVFGAKTATVSREVSPAGAAVFEVVRFEVRAADGVPARDGVLRQENGQWLLERARGVRESVLNPPAALQQMVGGRVFVVGAVGGAVQSFGVLRAP